LGNSSATFDQVHQRRSAKDYALLSVSLAVTVVLCVLVVVYWQEFLKFARYGYIGVFLISFLADITLFVPVPSLFIVFTMGGVLNPVLVGLIAGAGETIGSMVVYVTGLSSAKAFHALDHRVMDRFRTWIKTRGALSVFVMASILNPLFYPFTAIAGMMHFGWWRFLLLCLAGKTLKNMILAVAGYFGIKTLMAIFGSLFPL
jgi:membrane protein YqaA with SNARE-associated domain